MKRGILNSLNKYEHNSDPGASLTPGHYCVTDQHDLNLTSLIWVGVESNVTHGPENVPAH